MNVYSVDVKICATAYVKANSEEEALAYVKGLDGQALETTGSVGDVEVSGLSLTSPDLPDVSLSPAMTCYGVWDAETVPELAEEGIPV
ncbi:hypothetical protein [Hyphomicrobium sp.]|uniref:hypothetical protein n=1 Tax=Hyphomicrobium sp. TaxID=82 RepID=UPI001D60A583|nr:hypothetical protein [Hyphomicrobium sp.]MBY0560148.1 hypothetical protein [Hyphomicrobium sp.]